MASTELIAGLTLARAIDFKTKPTYRSVFSTSVRPGNARDMISPHLSLVSHRLRKYLERKTNPGWTVQIFTPFCQPKSMKIWIVWVLPVLVLVRSVPNLRLMNHVKLTCLLSSWQGKTLQRARYSNEWERDYDWVWRSSTLGAAVLTLYTVIDEDI